MKAGLDDDGQPPITYFRDRRAERQVSELLGLCKGMICDGNVSDGEALSLKRWLAANPDVLIGYPGQVLAERLVSIFADGHIDDRERADLSELLLDLVGEDPRHEEPLNLATRLPIDDPVPTILFDGMQYVFTGAMLYASRSECARLVEERNGRVGDSVTKKTNYLVIGPIASRAWLESTHGRKILRAVELRRDGLPIKILSEESWILALGQGF